MYYVVQVGPFYPPHHEADVLIPVTGDGDVNRIKRWFRSNALDMQVLRLDNDKDVVDLAKADQLIMTLADLATSGEGVLRNITPNGKADATGDT